MRKLLFTISLILSSFMLVEFVLPDNAFAQSRTGSRMGKAPAIIKQGNYTAEERKRLATEEFVKCVLSQKGIRSIRPYIESEPYSEEAYDQLDKLLLDECLSSGFARLGDIDMRGPVYEELYAKNKKLRKFKDLSNAPTIDYGSVSNANNSEVKTGILFRDFADCVTRRNTAGAQKLLKSRILSIKEKEAFKDLGEDFNECIDPDSKYSFSNSLLRGLLAEALYRLSTAEFNRLKEAAE